MFESFGITSEDFPKNTSTRIWRGSFGKSMTRHGWHNLQLLVRILRVWACQIHDYFIILITTWIYTVSSIIDYVYHDPKQNYNGYMQNRTWAKMMQNSRHKIQLEVKIKGISHQEPPVKCHGFCQPWSRTHKILLSARERSTRNLITHMPSSTWSKLYPKAASPTSPSTLRRAPWAATSPDQEDG